MKSWTSSLRNYGKGRFQSFGSMKRKSRTRYDLIRELSMKSQDILAQLNGENRQTIQDYIDEKDSLTGDELTMHI